MRKLTASLLATAEGVRTATHARGVRERHLALGAAGDRP
jgi:hypothetical protein